MKKIITSTLFLLLAISQNIYAQENFTAHPDVTSEGWRPLFAKDLSNSIAEPGVWSIEKGVITSTKDEALWTDKTYKNFILDLEFKNADSTNSGVIVHASDIKNWIPHSVEIQIADDYSTKWKNVNPNWQCAAIFGHQEASKQTVKIAGEWNHFTITCNERMIWVVLNGELVNTFDMSLYTSATKNPDGSDIPSWLSNPLASLPLEGYIGFQGKHAGAPIFSRNIIIKEL